MFNLDGSVLAARQGFDPNAAGPQCRILFATGHDVRPFKSAGREYYGLGAAVSYTHDFDLLACLLPMPLDHQIEGECFSPSRRATARR
jgi:hypothetical protein